MTPQMHTRTLNPLEANVRTGHSAGMSSGRWSAAGKNAGAATPPVSTSHDSAKPDGRQDAHRARGPDVPRHHLDRLGFQLARHQTPRKRVPPLTLRGTTGVIGATLLALLAISRGENLGCPRTVATAGAGRDSQRRRLDGVDGICAALASGQRGIADRLYHAGMGLHAGVARSRRTAESAAGDLAGDGVPWPRARSWAATVLRRAWQNCRA